jgi:RecA-family ATPase
VKTEWLIENILPTREIHLVGGPSGAGKTTWLLQTILAWADGQDVFGHKSHPLPYFYVSCDRSRESMLRTFQRCGVDPAKLPHISGLDERLFSPKSILERARKLNPDVRVLFIEGFAMFAPSGRLAYDYVQVATFFTDLTRMCQREDLTLTGVVHSSKMREGERYLNPRQRIHGSVAWAAFTETIILVEPADEKNPTSDIRSLLLLPRNSKAEYYQLAFDSQGMLQQRQDDDQEATVMLVFLSNQKPGAELSTSVAVEFGESHGLSRFQVMRWLNRFEEDARIEKSGHNCWKIRPIA